MSDKKVVIEGKEYYYDEMSDEALEMLFKTIKEKELRAYQKISKAQEILEQYED